MKLLPPCSYQGGKQRLAKQICEILIENADETTKFYDFCCGSGVIKLEFNGAKGGISGKHKITYTEYLNSV